VPKYIAVPGNASANAVADHIEHIARITGKGQSVVSFRSEKKDI
jgi:hypothetical protein